MRSLFNIRIAPKAGMKSESSLCVCVELSHLAQHRRLSGKQKRKNMQLLMIINCARRTQCRCPQFTHWVLEAFSGSSESVALVAIYWIYPLISFFIIDTKKSTSWGMCATKRLVLQPSENLDLSLLNSCTTMYWLQL